MQRPTPVTDTNVHSLFIKPATYQSRKVVSFFRPFAFFVRDLVSDVTPGTPSAVN